jgi:hypothetical protein
VRGRAFQRSGDCQGARREWIRAADLFDATEAAARSSRMTTPEQRRGAAQGWRESARKLGCR